MASSVPPALKSVWTAGPNGYLKGFIDSYPPGAGTSVFLFSPTVQPPSPTSPSFRPIAAADLTPWLGDLAVALVPTINSWANNEVVHQSCPGARGSRWLCSRGVGPVGKAPGHKTRPHSVHLEGLPALCSHLLGAGSGRVLSLPPYVEFVHLTPRSLKDKTDYCSTVWFCLPVWLCLVSSRSGLNSLAQWEGVKSLGCRDQCCRPEKDG